MRRRRYRARAGTTCAARSTCLLRVGLQASLLPSWLVSYNTLVTAFFLARLEGGLRLIVAQLVLETLLTVLLRLLTGTTAHSSGPPL